MIGRGGAWFPPALHGDHLGRVTLTTGAHGKGVGEARYTPYGEMRRGDPRGAIPTDRRFTGQRWEASLGLYDYRARFYDPTLGRFLQPDSLVQTDARHSTPYLPLAISYAHPKTLEQWNQLQRARLQREAQAPSTPSVLDPQFLNRYTYARNNSLAYVDDSGHIAWWVVGGIVGGVVGFGAYAITHRDNFDWRQAALWTASGAVIGGTFGAGAQWVAGALGAQTAATAATAATTAGAVARSPAGQRTILWLEEQLPRVKHILAPKHAWDRLIPLSGNILQDYRAIQPYIEYVIQTGQSKEIDMTKIGPLVEFVGIVRGHEVVVCVIQVAEGVFQISNAFVRR